MKQPNIILLLSDDQGYHTLNGPGSGEILTPNLDAMARRGMVFDRFFCVSPVCSPARASLLTGCIPSRHGVHDWLRNDETEFLQGQSTLPLLLSRAGYDCALSGKWHLGASHMPQQGFSHWYCHKSGGGPYYGAPMYRNGVLTREEKYLTEAITDDALAYLDSRAGQENPFFLYVAYTAPHGPWIDNHPKEFTDLYQDCPFESSPVLPRHPDSIFLTDDVMRNRRANLTGYYAAVTAMDYHIGRILAKVDEMGIGGDTLILFMSDNGFSCGHHGFFGKGNGTYPLNFYEESIRVPCIALHPGRIPEGKICHSLISAYDFFPTVLEYASIPCPAHVPRPGHSFLAALEGRPFDPRQEVMVMDEYGPNRMIRTERYKYIARFRGGCDAFYDLENDPGETENLLEKGFLPDKAKALKKRMDDWFSAYADPAADGKKEAVYGSGQLGLAGDWGDGTPAHSCDDYIRNSPRYTER